MTFSICFFQLKVFRFLFYFIYYFFYFLFIYLFFFFFFFFFFFLTIFGVPIIDSIWFSIINCDNDVICFSSLLVITRKIGKFSFALNINASGCVSSSEESKA